MGRNKQETKNSCFTGRGEFQPACELLSPFHNPGESHISHHAAFWIHFHSLHPCQRHGEHCSPVQSQSIHSSFNPMPQVYLVSTIHVSGITRHLILPVSHQNYTKVGEVDSSNDCKIFLCFKGGVRRSYGCSADITPESEGLFELIFWVYLQMLRQILEISHFQSENELHVNTYHSMWHTEFKVHNSILFVHRGHALFSMQKPRTCLELKNTSKFKMFSYFIDMQWGKRMSEVTNSSNCMHGLLKKNSEIISVY